MFVSDNQRNWDKVIPLFLLAYRSSQHESTGYTPSMLLTGREMRLPVDLMFSNPEDDPDQPTVQLSDYVANLEDRLRIIHELVRKKLKLKSDPMKMKLDHRPAVGNYNEGDAVWLYQPRRKKGLSPKLQRPCRIQGPYRIVKKINDLVFRIQLSPRSKPKVVHVERLSPYRGRNLPSWNLQNDANRHE